tara:strand:+ start:85 stop:966 length:882 start_codon:yes stop_codon:yes gene_type:complete
MYTVFFNLSSFSPNDRLKQKVMDNVHDRGDINSFKCLCDDSSTLMVGTQDYNTGRYTMYTNNKNCSLDHLFHHEFEEIKLITKEKDMVNAVVSSAALFPVYEPVYIECEDTYAIDGGYKHCIPVTEIKYFIQSSIEKKIAEIECDILVCHPCCSFDNDKEQHAMQKHKNTSWVFLTETQNIMHKTSYHTIERDIVELKDFIKNVLHVEYSIVENFGKNHFCVECVVGKTFIKICLYCISKNNNHDVLDRYKKNNNVDLNDFDCECIKSMIDDGKGEVNKMYKVQKKFDKGLVF